MCERENASHLTDSLYGHPAYAPQNGEFAKTQNGDNRVNHTPSMDTLRRVFIPSDSRLDVITRNITNADVFRANPLVISASSWHIVWTSYQRIITLRNTSLRLADQSVATGVRRQIRGTRSTEAILNRSWPLANRSICRLIYVRLYFKCVKEKIWWKQDITVVAVAYIRCSRRVRRSRQRENRRWSIWAAIKFQMNRPAH